MFFFLLLDQPASKQDEIDSIDNKLEQLSERQADLQKSHDIILNANNKTSKKGESEFTTLDYYSSYSGLVTTFVSFFVRG